MPRSPVNLELLTEIMQQFEHGEGEDAPFDLTEQLADGGDGTDEQWTDAAFAWARNTALDTSEVSGGRAEPDAYAYAGLLEGLCIGYLYAQGETKEK